MGLRCFIVFVWEDKAQVIVNAVTIVGDAMRNLWSGIQTAWSSASTFLSSVWTGILKPIFDGISTALQFVAGIVFTLPGQGAYPCSTSWCGPGGLGVILLPWRHSGHTILLN